MPMYLRSWQTFSEYGSNWLSAEELSKRREEILKSYYTFLASRIFRRTSPAFWDYHKQRLKDTSYPLSVVRLAKAVCILLIDLLLNPKQTVEKVLARRVAKEAARGNYEAMKITVIICTYKRSQSLTEALTSVASSKVLF